MVKVFRGKNCRSNSGLSKAEVTDCIQQFLDDNGYQPGGPGTGTDSFVTFITNPDGSCTLSHPLQGSKTIGPFVDTDTDTFSVTETAAADGIDSAGNAFSAGDSLIVLPSGDTYCAEKTSDTAAETQIATVDGVDSGGNSFSVGDPLLVLPNGETYCLVKTVDTDTNSFAVSVLATVDGVDSAGNAFETGDTLLTLPNGEQFCLEKTIDTDTDTAATSEVAIADGVDTAGNNYSVGDTLLVLPNGDIFCVEKAIGGADTFATSILATASGTDSAGNSFNTGDTLLVLPSGQQFCLEKTSDTDTFTSFFVSIGGGTDAAGNSYQAGDGLISLPGGQLVCVEKTVDTLSDPEAALSAGIDSFGNTFLPGDPVITWPDGTTLCVKKSPIKQTIEVPTTTFADPSAPTDDEFQTWFGANAVDGACYQFTGDGTATNPDWAWNELGINVEDTESSIGTYCIFETRQIVAPDCYSRTENRTESATCLTQTYTGIDGSATVDLAAIIAATGAAGGFIRQNSVGSNPEVIPDVIEVCLFGFLLIGPTSFDVLDADGNVIAADGPATISSETVTADFLVIYKVDRNGVVTTLDGAAVDPATIVPALPTKTGHYPVAGGLVEQASDGTLTSCQTGDVVTLGADQFLVTPGLEKSVTTQCSCDGAKIELVDNDPKVAVDATRVYVQQNGVVVLPQNGTFFTDLADIPKEMIGGCATVVVEYDTPYAKPDGGGVLTQIGCSQEDFGEGAPPFVFHLDDVDGVDPDQMSIGPQLKTAELFAITDDNNIPTDLIGPGAATTPNPWGATVHATIQDYAAANGLTLDAACNIVAGGTGNIPVCLVNTDVCAVSTTEVRENLPLQDNGNGDFTFTASTGATFSGSMNIESGGLLASGATQIRFNNLRGEFLISGTTPETLSIGECGVVSGYAILLTDLDNPAADPNDPETGSWFIPVSPNNAAVAVSSGGIADGVYYENSPFGQYGTTVSGNADSTNGAINGDQNELIGAGYQLSSINGDLTTIFMTVIYCPPVLATELCGIVISATDVDGNSVPASSVRLLQQYTPTITVDDSDPTAVKVTVDAKEGSTVRLRVYPLENGSCDLRLANSGGIAHDGGDIAWGADQPGIGFGTPVGTTTYEGDTMCYTYDATNQTTDLCFSTIVDTATCRKFAGMATTNLI